MRCNTPLARLVLALSCLLLAPLSHAASLGKLALHSGLGEPLQAEIEVLLAPQESLSDLVVALASEQAYTAQAIKYNALYGTLKVALQQNEQGLMVLQLSSTTLISEPYLDLLLQVDWPAGRLQKEYTVLLDSPQQATLEADPIVAPVASLPPDDEEVQSTMLADQPSEPWPLALTSKPGDSLSALAKAMPLEGVSLDQMLLGLYQANPAAFSAGNMNRLKVGQLLTVPDKETLLATQPDQATAEVKLHAANWQAYRAALANKVLGDAALPDGVQQQSASGKIASAEDKAAAAQAGDKDVLKLSAGGRDATKTADANVLAMQEDATAREKSLQESEQRAAALQKQIKDMQQLLQLKNQSMADLQKRAAEAQSATLLAQAEKQTMRWDWAVLLLTLLAISAAFAWLLRGNKRRAARLDLNKPTAHALLEPAAAASQHTQAAPDVASIPPEVVPVDLAGLDLNLAEPEPAIEPEPVPAPAPAKTALKRKMTATSFIKTDAHEVQPPSGDMDVIRIDLSAISLDLTGTEDEISLAQVAKTPHSPKT